jgi:hypothetical protein
VRNLSRWLICSPPSDPLERPGGVRYFLTSQDGQGRGIAQPGRALPSGGRGRRFESSFPDQIISLFQRVMSSALSRRLACDHFVTKMCPFSRSEGLLYGGRVIAALRACDLFSWVLLSGVRRDRKEECRRRCRACRAHRWSYCNPADWLFWTGSCGEFLSPLPLRQTSRDGRHETPFPPILL